MEMKFFGTYAIYHGVEYPLISEMGGTFYLSAPPGPQPGPEWRADENFWRLDVGPDDVEEAYSIRHVGTLAGVPVEVSRHNETQARVVTEDLDRSFDLGLKRVDMISAEGIVAIDDPRLEFHEVRRPYTFPV